ncbi:hypothetical protein ACOZ4N_20480 (plasmid) [Halorientalis pallida]|uniref:hypothetical protein n=1 Tax=Halorientalis pallida TaxID=2479928 RepID=UPI003C6F439F
MKSGASDPFGDSEDERSESSDTSSGERSDPRESEDERSESSESANGAERPVSEDDQSESSESRAASEADPEREGTADDRAEVAAAGEADTGGDGGDDADSATDAGISRDELPLVLRRDRVKDERPEVHQLFVQRETHDRAVDAERALEDRLGVDLSRTDAREAIYLAGMAHLDDAEEILRTWGYDL